MHRIRPLCPWLWLALAASAAAQPLPTDPALVTGQLENGLRYVVRQHAYPPGRAAIWIHFDSGSLNETDRQRGLAHYLEHLAFNGSENFPPGSVVPFFQSLGMQFGRDQNAFTSFEQTTYQLSLPDAKPETLAKGMTFFADVLHRLSLLPKEIEAERQIIQEERRRGLSGRQRTGFYVLERIAPGSLYGERITIGTEETINAVTEPDFRDYYGKWYVASNATVIVVADSDTTGIVNLIQEKFGGAPTKPRPTRQDPRVTAYDRSFAIVAHDPEVRSESIRIVRLESARPPTTTVPQFRADLVDRLGQMAMNRRLNAKLARGGTSYLGASVAAGTDANAVYTAEVSARANPGQWKAALAEVALELQRARQFGFSARELEDARKQLLTGAERAVETESTIPAQAILGRINGDIAAGEPTMSPQQQLDLFKQLLPTIKDEEICKEFAAEFDPQYVSFIAVLPSGPEVPTEAELLELGLKALAVKPEPEKETEHATVLMSELPKPGAVAEGAEHAATGIWSGWLSNGIRVHYRFMEDRKNDVSVRIALLGGELLETPDQRGITRAAQLAWSRPATDQLSSTDIRDLMTGKKVSVGGGGGMGGGRGGGRRGGGGGGGGDDSIALSISGSPEDLETGFQLAHLLLTRPKIEPAAFEQFQNTTRDALLEAQQNPMMLGMQLVGAAPFPDTEHRAQPLTVAQVDALTLASAQSRLAELLTQSPIEVTIVGDLPRERALELVTRYLGSLPPRDRVSPEAYAALRKVSRPAGPRVVERTIDSPTPQSFVFCGFYGADELNVSDSLALALAARILSTRMVKEVREDAQLVYSISAGSRPATTYPGFGIFSAAAPTDPSKSAALVAKLKSMYAKFAKDGPTDEELEVARKQFTNSRSEELRQPDFWARRMDRATFRGASFDDVLTEQDRYLALTGPQVRDVFAKYYAEPNTIVVSVNPSGGGKAPDSESDKPQSPGAKSPPPSGFGGSAP